MLKIVILLEEKYELTDIDLYDIVAGGVYMAVLFDKMSSDQLMIRFHRRKSGRYIEKTKLKISESS